jgi:GTP-binding protein
MQPMPVVAIVGRPNVGKSSLLNSLTGKRVSIVQDMPGVTRDRVSMPLHVAGRWVELVDTGGYGFEDAQGLTRQIKEQIVHALERAGLVLFVVDTEAGLTPGDEEIAALLRQRSAKTVILANKCDSAKSDVLLGDFARLGLGTPLGVSAKSMRNVPEILKVIQSNLDLSQAPTELPQPQMLVAIVGKRNAGKSTLVNAIARLYQQDDQRVIVSEVPGTTRDSVDVRFEKDGKALVVIDTAGVRKKRHMVTNDIEFYSFHRAQRSIRRADVVMLLLDATEPVSEPDQKLAQYIAEQFKPVLIVVNKWDLAREQLKQAKDPSRKVMDEELMEDYGVYLDKKLRHLDYAPVAFVTAKDGKNVQAALDLAQHLYKQSSERVGTGRLNFAVQKVFEERAPVTRAGRPPKVYFATQVGVNPPTIVLFVNKPELVGEQYRRFMVNRFRELLPYPEVPIRLLVKGKSEAENTGEMSADRKPVASAQIGKKAPRVPRGASGGGRKPTKRRGTGRRA